MSDEQIKILAKSILDNIEIWEMSDYECWVDGFVQGYKSAQQSVQRTCGECGCIEGHRPSCSKFGSYVESTRR